MKALLLSVVMLALPVTALGAGAWKWVDEKGVTQYSDTAPPSSKNAQPVDTRPYGASGGCSTCDWRAIERTERAAAPAPTASAPATPLIVAQSSARGMDYNVYLRLKTGMDEGELFNRAGAPDRESVENFREDIVKSFYYMPTQANPFITTVKLRGGKIVSIDRTRSN